MTERTTSPRTHLRIAAIGDLHVSKGSQGVFHSLFAQISATADVLVLCGDFTDYGLPEEARILAGRRPIRELIEDPSVADSVKDKLRLVLAARRFAAARRYRPQIAC